MQYHSCYMFDITVFTWNGCTFYVGLWYTVNMQSRQVKTTSIYVNTYMQSNYMNLRNILKSELKWGE